MVLHIHVNLAKDMNLIQVANKVQARYSVYTIMFAVVKWDVNT